MTLLFLGSRSGPMGLLQWSQNREREDVSSRGVTTEVKVLPITEINNVSTGGR